MNDKPIENNQDSRDANGAQETKPENAGKVFDHSKLARLVITERKPFRTSAVACGFSESVADHGMKALLRDSQVFRDAVNAEWQKICASVDRLKPVAVARLYTEIADIESPYGIRAIEIAGKFKETDWFVRNSETNIGIFAQMVENTVIVDNASDTFQD